MKKLLAHFTQRNSALSNYFTHIVAILAGRQSPSPPLGFESVGNMLEPWSLMTSSLDRSKDAIFFEYVTSMHVEEDNISSGSDTISTNGQEDSNYSWLNNLVVQPSKEQKN